jgi:hypothetical protein
MLLVLLAPGARAEPSTSLHPTDGLPPIGDIDTGHGGSTEPSCHQTFESATLVLDRVEGDGNPAVTVVDTGIVVPGVARIVASRLDAATTSSGETEVILRLDYATEKGGSGHATEVFRVR